MRILAPNPSPMTAEGTNAYVVGFGDVAVIDPGPDEAGHLAALEAAVAGRPVRAILVTHAHVDHSRGAARLGAALGAPVMAFGIVAMRPEPGLGGGEGMDRAFAPDARLADGDVVAGDGWTLRALHTPGHTADHLCFEWVEARAVFTGDTVMGWASTMISPPDGALGAFLASLDRLEALDAAAFHPGHGARVDAPSARCRALRDHRFAREAAILAALPGAPAIPDLVAALYADVPPALHGAAARNVLAHLLHLRGRGMVEATPAPATDARWRRTEPLAPRLSGS